MDKTRADTRRICVILAGAVIALAFWPGVAAGDPRISLRTAEEWRQAVTSGVARPLYDWDSGLEALYPGQSMNFRISQITPMPGFDEPFVEPIPGIVMEWGQPGDLGDLIGAWTYDYISAGGDPDLTGFLISIWVKPPIGISSVGVGIKDANGWVKYWTWNVGVGPGWPLQAGVQTPILINPVGGASQANASGFYEDPAFDLTQSVGIIFLEQGNYVNFLNPSPFNNPRPWNYWKKLAVYPNPLKWNQPPYQIAKDAAGRPIFLGWDQPSYDPVLPQWRSIRLADDWQCQTDYPVTDIHWWGSHVGWIENTMVPPVAPIGFLLEIYTDIPAGQDPGYPYSHPGVNVWSYTAYNVPPAFVGYDKDPDTGAIDSCWYYSVNLPTANYFYQQPMGTSGIFWLSISPIYAAGAQVQFPWGWKTRPKYFMDDAVQEPPVAPPAWMPIRTGWDLAFELTTNGPFSPLKWSQPPVQLPNQWYNGKPLYNGWDQPGYIQGPVAPQQAADDFKCVRPRPIIGIDWWGSYLNWLEPVAPTQRPIAFWFGIYTDIPKGPNELYSHPGTLVWSFQTDQTTPATPFSETFVGFDTMDLQSPYTLNDSCFKYRVNIPRRYWYWQQPGTVSTVYWLSIKAIFANPPQYEWGWKTRPHYWNDDGVYANLGSSNGGTPLMRLDKSWDLTFVLRSLPWIFIQPTLKDLVPTPNLPPITIMLRDPITGDIPRAQTFNMVSNPDALAMEDVEPGVYDVIVQPMSHWLRKVAYNTDLTSYDTEMLQLDLTNGDNDMDNEITSTDMSIILKDIDTGTGVPDPTADLDGDGMVTAADLAIGLASMDLLGDN